MMCDHKFVYMESVRQKGERPSMGVSSGNQWKRIDRFFCEKCLEFKDKVQTAEGWEHQPEWWQ